MSCATADELEPPWAHLPWIQLGSIGWRMGVGEGYQIQWGDWANGAIQNIDAALLYLRRHPPAPRPWRNWIASWLAELAGDEIEFDDNAIDQPRTRWDDRVDDEELTDDDAAYPVFVRNAERNGGMLAPWAWRESEVPYNSLRYSARELGWWARWLTTVDRAAHLDAQPAPRPEWHAIARAARSGEADPAKRDLEGMVCTLAATGTLPPPWLHGLAPKKRIDYDETGDERDRWLWWVNDTFDDVASWDRYLAPWPMPADWQHAFEEDLYLGFR